jgi:rod shape-determining protein MreD
MNVSVGTIFRLALLVLVTVVIQLAVVTQITVLDADADLFPLVVLSVGLLAGPIPGATTGFLLGLLADMALLQTLGVTSLLLIGVGYLSGRYRELRDASHKLVPVIGAFAGTLAYSVSFSLTQFLLGVDSPVSPLVIRELLIGALLNALIAMPVFAAVRFVLRPDLIDDLRPRRRAPAAGLRLTGTVGRTSAVSPAVPRTPRTRYR